MKYLNCYSYYYADVVSTVHPVGIPLLPVVVQVAAEFLTNVPLEATPLTQFDVYEEPGVVVNIALI
jgi:hypothetical protein